ncbi:putative Beat protein, partial [Operophtera brumata]
MTEAITSAHNITQLKVPLYADPRRAAELSCHFQMEDQRLHSVKWYRDMNEIFRYNPSQRGGECQADSCMVRVMPSPIATRAGYTCEVSTEGPKFQIARKTKHMTVVAMPDVDPVISSAQKVLKPGESMFLNCTSDYSLPPADINWYIDDELQKVPRGMGADGTKHSPAGGAASLLAGAQGACPTDRERRDTRAMRGYTAGGAAGGTKSNIADIVLLAIILTVKEIS